MLYAFIIPFVVLFESITFVQFKEFQRNLIDNTKRKYINYQTTNTVLKFN